MSAPRSAALVLALGAAMLAAGCHKEKPPAPKVDEAVGERARADIERTNAAMERARHDAFGAQVRSLDKAKALEADVNAKATESLEKIDKDNK
jgi:hypothetical protein